MTDLLIMCFFSAATFMAGKLSLVSGAPLSISGTRMIVGGFVLLSYLFWRDKKLPQIDKQHLWLFAQVSLFFIAFAYGGDFWALQYVSASKASMIYSASPFLAAALAYYAFGEAITRKKAIGLCIGIVGYVPLLLHESVAERALPAVGFLSLPEIMFILATVATVYGFMCISQLVKTHKYDPIMVNAVSMLTGGLLTLIVSFLFEGLFDVTVYNTWSFVYWVLFLVLISNVVCMNLYSIMLKRYSATFISFVGFITPVFTAILEWLVKGSWPTTGFWLTMGIVFIGVYLFYQEELALADL